jgi:hypothetical protein
MASERSIADACSTLIQKLNYIPSPRTIDVAVEDAVISEITSWGLELEKSEVILTMIHATSAIPDVSHHSSYLPVLTVDISSSTLNIPLKLNCKLLNLSGKSNSLLISVPTQ